MKVIAGLGNPGSQYQGTRHNIGFVLMDMMAESLALEFRSKYQGLLAEGKWKGERVFFFKPMTFMNLSGKAMREILNYYKIPSENLLVVYDDMDLPVGKLRLRNKGQAGGHNGIRSILVETGSEDFWRLKIGVGRPPEGWNPADYVLAAFSREDSTTVEEALGKAAEMVKLWLDGDPQKAMNLYNR